MKVHSLIKLFIDWMDLQIRCNPITCFWMYFLVANKTADEAPMLLLINAVGKITLTPLSWIFIDVTMS